MAREAKFIASVGAKGSGKTEESLKEAVRYVRRGSNYLLFDLQNEFGSYDIKSIGRRVRVPVIGSDKKSIYNFTRQTKPQVRRIIFFHPNGEPMSSEETIDVICEVLTVYMNGGALVEDVAAVMGAVYKKDFTGRIISQRHKSCDIALNFQSFKKILSPAIYPHLNAVRLHRFKGSIDKYKSELDDDFEMFKLAKTLVDLQFENNNKRFFCYVNMDESVIQGKFDQAIFIKAIDKYISTTYDHTIKPMLDERNEKGKKIYTHETALRFKRQQLLDSYYGNAR